MMGLRFLSLPLLGVLVSCSADHFPSQVQEVHVEFARSTRDYPLIARFTNSTTSSSPSLTSSSSITSTSSSSSTDEPPPPPLTTFPPPTAVSTSEVTSVTTNTHTNIDGTEVPVLHGCSFCPPGSDSGLLLFGIPAVPGIYPPPPNPPVPNFPTIIIGSDGNPTEDDGPTTTSPTTKTSTTSPSTTQTSTTTSSETSSTTSSTSSETPTSTMVEVDWEDWESTEESSSEDDEAAEYAQSQIDSAFGSSSITSSTSSSTTSSSTTSSSTTSSSTTTSTTTTTSPTSTSETATPTPPPTPLERGPIMCHDEDDFRGHADISPGSQDEFSKDFSGLDDVDEYLSPGSAPIVLNIKDGHGVSYQYSASWLDGCNTTVDKQSYRFPLGSPSLITAYLLVREDYTKCANGGVGGKSQAGCLVFEFTGGR